MYSQDAETDAGQSEYPGRGRPEHALPEGRGHQAMDIDSAAAHRIPRGESPKRCHVYVYHMPKDYGHFPCQRTPQGAIQCLPCECKLAVRTRLGHAK